MQEKTFEALSEERKVFKFILNPRNWFERILFKFKLKKQFREVEISPINYGSRAKYSKYALRLDIQKIGNGVSATRTALMVGDGYTDDIIQAIATVMHNDPYSNPPNWMIRELHYLTQEKLDELLKFLSASLDVQSFLSSIILINGMSLQTEEIIAPENKKESQGNTK